MVYFYNTYVIHDQFYIFPFIIFIENLTLFS